MESMGVFEHKDVKCNPEGVGILLKNIQTPGMPLGVQRVGGWVSKIFWKTHYSIIKVCFLIIFIARVPTDRMSIVFVHDDDIPLLVTGERDNTNEFDVGESGSEDENEALFEAAVDEESENEDIPFNDDDAPMDDTAKQFRWRNMKNNRNMNLDTTFKDHEAV